MNALDARARAVILALGASLVITACGSPPPPAPLPNVASQEPSERLSIDGLWKTRSEPEVYVQLERGRLYLQLGFAPGQQHGTVLYADVHQAAPGRYRCRQPRQREGRIVWHTCSITLEGDGSLRAVTPDPEDEEKTLERRFVSVALADEVWFAAQSQAWHIVSIREAHEPPPPARIIGRAPIPELPPSPGPSAVAVAVPSRASRFGRYRALVIGSAEYQFLPGVATAAEDAAAVSKLLADRYGFQVTHLRNPSLVDLSNALTRLEREAQKDDNVLIYYAGHGFVSDERGRCSWFPVEALGEQASQGLASDDVAASLERMKAKHAIVVADSCFTASELREVGLVEEGADERERLSKLRTRVVLSSGGLEPIQNGQGSGHSVFTGAFLSALGANREVLEGQSLFSRIQQIVTAGASQTPEYANIRGADHRGGDFLFVPTP